MTTKQSARFNTDLIICEDLQKPKDPILTGVGFLDHMIDQFNSHAQIGISMSIHDFANDTTTSNTANQQPAVSSHDHRNRHADHDQAKLMRLVGSKIGAEFKRLTQESKTTGTFSRFSCPLDEALVLCEIKRVPAGFGNLVSFTLPPYGKYPATATAAGGGGRKYIGKMETDKLSLFWESLAEHADLELRLEKLRGDNAHHIVESSFKAFARAFRNLLDGTNAIVGEGNDVADRTVELYGLDSANWKEGVAQCRQGSVKRQTKETSISATVLLDGGSSGVHVDTGIQTLNNFFTTLAKNACMSLNLECKGDLWIDEHHTAEDVAIAMGQVLTEAFGTKAGLNRMWCAAAVKGQAKIEVVMDLSNRPCLTHNLSLDNNGEEMVGDLSLEMFEHVLDSLVVNARMTVHVVEIQATSNLEDTVEAVAEAFGKALKYCAMVDLRRSGATASSKGTLSV